MKLGLFAGLTFGMAMPAQACRLALALTVDVSGSIDPGEYRLQMRGLADALRDPEVANALVQAQAAVMVMQWSGRDEQEISVPWTRMLSLRSVDRFADTVWETKRRWHGGKTAIGDAIAFTVDAFPAVGDCTRRVIDVSGDGMTNDGRDPGLPRDSARREDVQINGIAIERMGRSVTQFFRRHVASGPGSFVLTAQGYLDYPRAIREKLIRETVIPAM